MNSFQQHYFQQPFLNQSPSTNLRHLLKPARLVAVRSHWVPSDLGGINICLWICCLSQGLKRISITMSYTAGEQRISHLHMYTGALTACKIFAYKTYENVQAETISWLISWQNFHWQQFWQSFQSFKNISWLQILDCVHLLLFFLII